MDKFERFDNFLITIVNETGGVEGLLHSMFSFLFRRTDFFYEMMPGEKMGFLPGEAERMVITDSIRWPPLLSSTKTNTLKSILQKTLKKYRKSSTS